MNTKYEENPFAGFFLIQRLLGKSLEISSNFSIGLLFSQFDWWVPMTWGLNPYFIWGSNTFFLAVSHLFGITKCSKSLDLVRMG